MTGTSDDGGRARHRAEHDHEAATPEQIDHWVEHTIRQAQRRGAFDDLPGAGKPLTSLERSDGPDWWLRELIRREKLDLSAALPGPMALRRERATYPKALVGIADEAEVRAVLEDFNQRVLDDRRRPVATAASPVVAGRVDVPDMVQRWRELREATLPVTDQQMPGSASTDGARRRGRPMRRRGWWRRRD